MLAFIPIISEYRTRRKHEHKLKSNANKNDRVAIKQTSRYKETNIAYRLVSYISLLAILLPKSVIDCNKH